MCILSQARFANTYGMTQKQHVEKYRKLGLRRLLLAEAELIPNSTAYAPFIGSGDIAAELYGDYRIYGADLDPSRVGIARSRLPEAQIIVADCDGWPFPTVREPFALADFDAYANPYTSFLAFWHDALKAEHMALVFTDGMRQTIVRKRQVFDFGSMSWRSAATATEFRVQHNNWLTRFVLPWFEETIAPWRMVAHKSYRRGWMTYWGAVVQRWPPGLVV